MEIDFKNIVMKQMRFTTTFFVLFISEAVMSIFLVLALTSMLHLQLYCGWCFRSFADI